LRIYCNPTKAQRTLKNLCVLCVSGGKINTKSNIERDIIHNELEKLSNEDPEGFEKAVMESARKTLTDIKELGEIRRTVARQFNALTTYNQ